MAKGGGHGKGQTMPYRVVRTFGEAKPMRAAHWTLGAAQADMLNSLRAANRLEVVLEIELVDAITGETIETPLKCVVCDVRWATETGHTRGAEAPSTCLECEFMDEAAEQAPMPAMPQPGTPLVVDESRLDEMIVGEVRSGKTSQASVAAVAEQVVAELVGDKPIPQYLEAAVAGFARTNKLPDADPSALLEALDRLNIERAVWSDGTVAAVANGILWTMQAEPHAVGGGPCGVWSVGGPVGVRGHFMPERAARFIRDRKTP